MHRRVFSTFAAALLASVPVQAQTITTVAGKATVYWGYGFCGDGGPATSACLNWPTGVAADAAGTLFIADHNSFRIRKVDTLGAITTVAGSGGVFPYYGPSFCGDGGPATSACLNGPLDVAVDLFGNLFIAEQNRVRKVDAAGIITTVAGSGVCSGPTGDGGPATSACLRWPFSVAVDAAGNLFIADRDDRRIRKVDAAGIITTVAGVGSCSGLAGDGGPATNACLVSPYDVALDADGGLFIADHGDHRIRKVDSAGTITTVAGKGTKGFCGDGGAATSACLDSPWGVAVDAFGYLLIADTSTSTAPRSPPTRSGRSRSRSRRHRRPTTRLDRRSSTGTSSPTPAT